MELLRNRRGKKSRQPPLRGCSGCLKVVELLKGEREKSG